MRAAGLVRASAADLDDILAIDRESFTHPWTRQMYEEDLRLPHSRIWVLRATDGSALGYCATWVLLDEVHINNVAVAERARRRGFGEQLVRHAVETGAGEGAKRVFLDVRASNKSAISLYSRLGFAVAGQRRAYYAGPTEDAILMECAIQMFGIPPHA
jgi:[ribosomal protein S18]-alanine N-acetyltransferase